MSSGNRVLLIVEDDPKFAQTLLDIPREKGFKGIVTLQGETAHSLARQFHPDAITLDSHLPDLDGWTVLDRLKIDPTTRPIPVPIISVEDGRPVSRKRGAFASPQTPPSTDTLERSRLRL